MGQRGGAGQGRGGEGNWVSTEVWQEAQRQRRAKMGWARWVGAAGGAPRRGAAQRPQGARRVSAARIQLRAGAQHTHPLLDMKQSLLHAWPQARCPCAVP